jgi:hypothetical protein
VAAGAGIVRSGVVSVEAAGAGEGVRFRGGSGGGGAIASGAGRSKIRLRRASRSAIAGSALGASKVRSNPRTDAEVAGCGASAGGADRGASEGVVGRIVSAGVVGRIVSAGGVGRTASAGGVSGGTSASVAGFGAAVGVGLETASGAACGAWITPVASTSAASMRPVTSRLGATIRIVSGSVERPAAAVRSRVDSKSLMSRPDSSRGAAASGMAGSGGRSHGFGGSIAGVSNALPEGAKKNSSGADQSVVRPAG